MYLGINEELKDNTITRFVSVSQCSAVKKSLPELKKDDVCRQTWRTGSLLFLHFRILVFTISNNKYTKTITIKI